MLREMFPGAFFCVLFPAEHVSIGLNTYIVIEFHQIPEKHLLQ